MTKNVPAFDFCLLFSIFFGLVCGWEDFLDHILIFHLLE
jgi:hypothetical protein